MENPINNISFMIIVENLLCFPFWFSFVICHKENIDNEGSHYLWKNK